MIVENTKGTEEYLLMKKTNAVYEIEFRYKQIAAAGPKLTKSSEVNELIKKATENCDTARKEYFHAIFLTRANNVLAITKISEGGTTGTIADGKVIFADALNLGAKAIILTHNHPSGTLKPSASDLTLTRKLREFGQLIEIEILDHLITTEEGFYYSFADNGTL